MADPRIKQLKIKTGVAKRLTKEFGYYEKEVVKEEERQKKMVADGQDQHVINKQTEVINESKAMIPDTKNRLHKAKEDLSAMIESEQDLAETEEYKGAMDILKEAEKVLAQKD